MTRGPFGYYSVAQQRASTPKQGFITEGNIHIDERRLVHPGRVDDQQPAHDQRRHPHREREACRSTRGEGHPGVRHRVRLRREVGAAPRLRVRRQGRRPDEGVRQLGNLLRHLQARAAPRLVRRRQVARVLLHARHADWTTLVDGASCPPACPGRSCVALRPRTTRWAGSTSVSRRSDARDRPGPGADAVAGSSRSASSTSSNTCMAVGAATSTSRSTRRSKTSARSLPEGNEVYVIANPGSA